MNREEAIRVLEDNRPSVIFEDEDAQKRMAELCQAIDMAIEALSADAEQEAVPTVVRVTMSDGSQYYLEHERNAMKGGAE